MALELKNGLPTIDSTSADGFPSDLVDPADKGRDWCLRYVKAGYWRHTNNLYFITYNRRSDFIVNRLYAIGCQTTSKYINWLSKLKNSQNQTLSYLDLDWSIVSTIPKFRDVVLSYLQKIDYDIFADAINPEAAADREAAKVKIMTEMQLQPFFKAMAELAKQPLDQQESEFMPETKSELDLWMQYGFRLNYEIAMELGIQAVYNENDWKEVRKLMLEDAFDLGVMAAETYIDRISGRIKVKYVDPVNMIVEDFRGHDGSAMPRIGYIEKMTIAQLKLEAGNQFTEKEYYDIAEKFRGWAQNPQEMTPYADYINTDITQYFRMYDNYEILVMKYQWDSVDRYKYMRRTVDGQEFVFPEKFDAKLSKKSHVNEQGLLVEKEVYATDVKTIYQAKWIVGSDFIYDYGKAANIPRPAENQKECHKSIKFYRISNKSMIDRILPYADSLQLSWLKIQNLKARASGKGMMIEIGAFDNVFIDSKLVTAQEILQAGMQTGIWTYRRNSTLDDDGYDNSGRPMEETEGGMGTMYQELIQSMASDIAAMNETIGLNAFTNATTPNPDSLVGIADLAVQSSQDALHPLLSGFISIHEQMSLTICLLMQILVRYNKYTGYVPALGNMQRGYIEVGEEILKDETSGSLVAYGVRIQARATAEQKQRLMKYADMALASSQDPSKGGIELPDLIELSRLIENGTNLKLVANILGARIKKYKQEMQAMAQQNIQLQSQEIIKQNESASIAKQKQLALEVEANNAMYTHKTNEDIRKLQYEWQFKTQNEVTKGAVKQDLEVTKAAVKPV